MSIARNDEGEVEWVMGNSQLIAIFLVIVFLIAVFFIIGYRLGRNAAPEVASASHSVVVDHTAEPAPSRDSSPAPTAAAPAPAPAPREQAKPSPLPEKPAAAAAPAKTAPEPAAKEPRSDKADLTHPGVIEPAAGQYWQVLAAARPDAEVIAEELAKKGMSAFVAPSPRPDFYRVLVGPFSNAVNMADMRTKLEASGFKNPIVRKY